MADALKVLVLGGGPDREREVSLRSAASVANALRRAGHKTLESDIRPGDLSPLDLKYDVIFPVLHGRWGEGGALQKILDDRGLKYVGSRARAADTAMDKGASKHAADLAGVPTAPYQLIGPGVALTITAPLVFKPVREGSSFGVEICRSQDKVEAARGRLEQEFGGGMAEKFVKGREVTVGIVDQEPLPPIMIVPAVEFYDFNAKYDRNDTRYDFELGLPEATVEELKRSALKLFNAIGCRHLSRVDFIVDEEGKPWFLEINTLPGFTDHSLLPKAAAKAGYDMDALCDRLVRLAMKG